MRKKYSFFVVILIALGCTPLNAFSDNNQTLARKILDYSDKFKNSMCQGDPANHFDMSGVKNLERALSENDFLAVICQKIGKPCEVGAFRLSNELIGFKNCITAVNEENQPSTLYDICCETAEQFSFYMNKYLNPQGDRK